MKEYLEKNYEFVEEQVIPSSLLGNNITYWMFKINGIGYCLSFSAISRGYVLSDYDFTDETIGEMLGVFGSKNQVKEKLKRLSLTRYMQ